MSGAGGNVSIDLSGRLALVTGSSSGIGLGIAKKLASAGCSVILNGFGSPDTIAKVTQDVKDEYQKGKCYSKEGSWFVRHIDADLSKGENVKKLYENIKEINPSGVDILVNNAGLQHVCPVESFPEDKWQLMMDVMLTAPFLLTKNAVPDMKAKGWGRIINISSVHGLKASPNKSAYVAAKHGLVGFTKVVSLETAGTGITCNAICPGYVDTPILHGQVQALAEEKQLPYEDAQYEFLSKFHPAGQPVGIDQLGEMVLFLCTDAASHMTGSSVVMDGAWNAH